MYVVELVDNIIYLNNRFLLVMLCLCVLVFFFFVFKLKKILLAGCIKDMGYYNCTKEYLSLSFKKVRATNY